MTVPTVRLEAHVHPLAMHVDPVERMVTVRLDVIAPGTSDGAVPRPVNFALVLDRSGSMERHQKLETAKLAAIRAVERLQDQDVFTLVAFSEMAEVIVPAARIGPNRQAVIARLQQLTPQSTTFLARGLQAAFDQLRPHFREGTSSAMFVLTDGEAHDPADCTQLAPAIVAKGVSIYGGGIGPEYKHKFLEGLCADPIEKGKYLVDHIDLNKMASLTNLFDSYLKRKGHVVTASCRLTVHYPTRRVRFHSATAKEHGLVLKLDDQGSTALVELHAGGSQQYQFEFVVTPSTEGNLQVAKFSLRYDLPGSGIVGAVSETSAQMLVTRKPGQEFVPNPMVVELAKRLQATRLLEQAEVDLEKKDVRGATRKLERVTRVLKELGQDDQAHEVEERRQTIEASDPAQLDLEIKRVRGMTKRLSE
jgi:hypothetical protein